MKTVIDLQRDGSPAEKQFVETAGMQFHRIPMTTSDPANQPVYVHCAGGRHRTGVMTAAYRMTRDNWAADQAFKEMKQYKFGADFLHPEFKRFVYSYHPDRTPATPAVLATNVISNSTAPATAQ